MAHVLTPFDLYPRYERGLTEKPKKLYHSEGKTCPAKVGVEESITHKKKNKDRNMSEVPLYLVRDERLLEQEFALEASCFDLFPTLMDIHPPAETLKMRWVSLWKRVDLNLRKALREAK